MEAASSSRIDVGGVISETFRIYGANAAPLLGSAAVVFVVIGIAQALLYDAGGIFLSLLATGVALAGQALYTGFVVKLVEDVRDGRRDFTVSELFSSASGAIVPLIVNGLLRGIAIAIGFFLLIVPGLILLTLWAVTSPAIVAERQGIIGAFGRSWELVRGNGWSVFGVILIAFLISIGVSIVAASIGAGIGTGATVVLGTIAAILTAPIAATVASVLFFDLGGGGGAVGDQVSSSTASPPPAG